MAEEREKSQSNETTNATNPPDEISVNRFQLVPCYRLLFLIMKILSGSRSILMCLHRFIAIGKSKAGVCV